MRTGIHPRIKSEGMLRLKTLWYKFLVHVRHPGYRLVTRADVPFSSGTSEDEWKVTRRREANDVNAGVRELAARRSPQEIRWEKMRG
jgi:hypothetical protein